MYCFKPITSLYCAVYLYLQSFNLSNMFADFYLDVEVCPG